MIEFLFLLSLSFLFFSFILKDVLPSFTLPPFSFLPCPHTSLHIPRQGKAEEQLNSTSIHRTATPVLGPYRHGQDGPELIQTPSQTPEGEEKTRRVPVGEYREPISEP